jgi:pseudaminic acid synthase
MREFQIGNRWVGESHEPFVIAEMSGNHNGSLERAIKIVEAAAAAGADALKIQTYTADTMTLNLSSGEFVISDPKSLWCGKSLYELYSEASTPWEWHEAIFRRCNELGIIGFSTPFDESAVDFLQSLNVPAYKVASFENTDLPLIQRIARSGRPTIVSTGMASADELAETVAVAKRAGCKDIVLLKCTSSYPASPEHSNLRTIDDLRKRFDVQAGLSDHTLGTSVALASVGMGATVIEKHFTLCRADGGPDAAFSMEPHEFAELVAGAKMAWQAMGMVKYGPTDSEKRSLQFRRSLYIVKDIKAGEALSPDNVRAIRPGLGISPKHYDAVLGARVARDVLTGTPVSWDLIEVKGQP